MSQRTGTGKRRRRKRTPRHSPVNDKRTPEDTSAKNAAVTTHAPQKIVPLVVLQPNYSKQEIPTQASKVSPIEDSKEPGKSGMKEPLSSSNGLSHENTNSKECDDEKQRRGSWLPKTSEATPMSELRKKIRHVQLASRMRVQSSSWTKGERHKYREDAIARQVLWMALITHLGKRTKMDVSIKKKCVLGPHVMTMSPGLIWLFEKWRLPP